MHRVFRFGWIALGLGFAAAAAAAQTPRPAPLRIGIIGTGHIGGTLARLWVAAGHEVLISSRHPDQLRGLAQQLGPRAAVGTPREAALFGAVVLISVPYGAEPQIGRDLKAELAGKIVLDTGNPYPERDGPMALEARREGTGVASARTPTPGLVSATPSVCRLAGELHPHPSVPQPQPLGPAHEAVDFIAAGTCTIVATTGGQGITLLQTQFDIAPAEVRQSVTVTVPPDSPAVRKQAKHLLKALRLPAGAKPVQIRSQYQWGSAYPTPDKRPGVILADDHGYWRVRGKPEAVIAWIEAHRPARSTPAVSRDGPGNHPGANLA